REPEEGQRIAVADVEEEVLAVAAGQVDRLDQWHAQDVAVELHRLGHVLAHQRQVVDAADVELAVGRSGHGFLQVIWRSSPRPDRRSCNRIFAPTGRSVNLLDAAAGRGVKTRPPGSSDRGSSRRTPRTTAESR